MSLLANPYVLIAVIVFHTVIFRLLRIGFKLVIVFVIVALLLVVIGHGVLHPF